MVQGRYKKGESGNPKGMKAGTFTLMPFIRRKLMAIPEGEKEIFAHKFIDAYLKDVMEKPEMKKDLLDRTDGKPKQDVGISGQGEDGAIEVRITMK